jgi:hypothetical protein
LVVVGLEVVCSANVVSTPIRAVIITDVWLPNDVTAVSPVPGAFVGVVCGVVCVILLVGAVVDCVFVMVLNGALGVGVGVVFVVGAVVS